jgi:hypothetical protein
MRLTAQTVSSPHCVAVMSFSFGPINRIRLVKEELFFFSPIN